METQRQWTLLAIARATPALFGLFSVVTLLAHPTLSAPAALLPHTAWYAKPLPTFADALAVVRRRLWASLLFQTSPLAPDPQKIPRTLVDHLCGLLCYAASNGKSLAHTPLRYTIGEWLSAPVVAREFTRRHTTTLRRDTVVAHSLICRYELARSSCSWV
jgi:hypothetical protein